MKTSKRLAVAAAAAALALAGCAGSPAQTPDDPATAVALLAAYDLAGLDGRQIVDRLERTPVDERAAELTASVRPGELLLSETGSDRQATVDLPEDAFYLSIAPYLEQTHECFFHSLTTCRGELAGARIQVTVTDRDTGEVLVDEVTETFDNGFLGLWLPSGIDATLQVGHEGHSAVAEIATGPEDPTCLTTVQLVPSG